MKELNTLLNFYSLQPIHPQRMKKDKCYKKNRSHFFNTTLNVLQNFFQIKCQNFTQFLGMETLRKYTVSTKFSHRGIRRNFGISCSVLGIEMQYNLGHFILAQPYFSKFYKNTFSKYFVLANIWNICVNSYELIYKISKMFILPPPKFSKLMKFVKMAEIK